MQNQFGNYQQNLWTFVILMLLLIDIVSIFSFTEFGNYYYNGYILDIEY